jgi:hypothetical protein
MDRAAYNQSCIVLINHTQPDLKTGCVARRHWNSWPLAIELGTGGGSGGWSRKREAIRKGRSVPRFIERSRSSGRGSQVPISSEEWMVQISFGLGIIVIFVADNAAAWLRAIDYLDQGTPP